MTINMELYNPKNPDEFKQENLPEPAPAPLNIEPVPEGSVVAQGSLSSPNYRQDQIGWRLSSDGSFEAVDGNFIGTITADDGTIGGFVIGTNTIVGGNLTLNSSGYFECVQSTGKAKLSSSGLEFIIGSTVNANILLSSNDQLRFVAGGGSGDANSVQIDFTETSAAVGNFSPTNGAVNLGTSSNRYQTIYLVNTPDVSSDLSLKTDIADMGYGLEQVKKMKALKYKIGGKEALGFSAEEVSKIFPEIAHKNEDGLYSMRPMELIPIMVKAMQELSDKVKSLEDEITKLKAKI